MRITKLILVFIFFSKWSYPQSDTASLRRHDKIIICISGGVTIPLGKYSTFEINDGKEFTGTNIAGAAQIGYNYRLNAVYLFSKNFGLNFTVFEVYNKASTPDSSELFYDPCPTCHGLGGGSRMKSYSYNTSNWLTNGFLLGLTGALYSENTTLMFRINPGIQKTGSPQAHLHQEGFLYQGNWTTTYPYSSDVTQPSLTSKYNFAIGGGIDLIIAMKKRLRVIISMDYLASKGSFSGDLGETYYNGYYQSTIQGQYPFNFDKNISLFNLNIGIGYKVF